MPPQNRPPDLDEQLNPIKPPDLDASGNPIPEMPDASKMLKTGIKETGKIAGGFWDFLNTSAIPEPTEQDWQEHPIKSTIQWGGSMLATPFNQGGRVLKIAGEALGVLGAAGAATLAYRRMKNANKAAEFAESVAPEIKAGEDILASEPVRPMFNPKGKTGMTGTLQSKA